MRSRRITLVSRGGRTWFAPILALLAGLFLVIDVGAGPSSYGFSDRVERHLLPEVTTGPAEPTWSPDGRRLAFSMQGDIWMTPAPALDGRAAPADAGAATAITHGPWTYFEPAWSPDGRSIAVTMETGGQLDLGLIDLATRQVTRLTSDTSADIEPAWSPDGHDLYFASSRGRGFGIFRLRLDDRSVASVVDDGGDQIQPAVSPDGHTLAYVSPVAGRLGTGGLWKRSLGGEGDSPVLIHYEESEYRMRPRWTSDGRALLYGSDQAGSNDVAIVSATGGNPVVLTDDPMGEYSPAPAPDGATFAFISNRTGPMTLFVAPVGGGPVTSWHRVSITARRAMVPTGRLRGRVLDPDGRPVAARIELVAADGRSYAPDDGFARLIAVSNTPYFHTGGAFEVDLPAGPAKVEALRGFEFQPAQATPDVVAGATTEVTLRLRRLVDAPALGWYSGDTHAHDLHQGRFGLTHETLFAQSLAEDLHVTNVLIHMDGTRLMGRWADLTGEPDRLSTPTHLLQFAEEFRGSLGHIGLLGVSRYVLPLTGGVPNTAYAETASDVPYLDGARAQGGIAGFMHPYTASSPSPAGWAGSLIPVDVALGKGEFYDVASLYSDEQASAEMYYRLLNCGFRLAATAGTDNFPDVWRDPPPGTDRTYAKIDGRLTIQSWLAAVEAGHTFGTTGPLVFLTVGGQDPGSEIRLGPDAPPDLTVTARVLSIAPFDSLDILVNGQVVASASAAQPGGLTFSGAVSVPTGGWVAARVIGPPSARVADSYAFAQTSPVYVVRGGKRFVSRDDARFLAAVVDAIEARADRAPWRSAASKAAFNAEIDRARQVYLALAAGGAPFDDVQGPTALRRGGAR